jgi:cellulase/cellobiase CelA1
MSRLRRRFSWAAAGLAAATAAAAALVLVPTAQAALLPGYPNALFYASDRTKAWAYSEARPPNVKVHREVVKSTIASQPSGIWYSNWSGEGLSYITNLVRNEVSRAAEQRKIPVLVPYMLPFRDCGNLSSGGAPDSAQWRNWIQRITWGIGYGLADHPSSNVPVYILLEPDAVALQSGDSGCVDGDGKPTTFDVAQRNSDLRYAVEALTNAVCIDPTARSCPWWQSRVKVFLDAGHSKWYGSDLTKIANRLNAAGVGSAAGFYTNASNYQPTASEITYGQNLRAKLQDPHAPYQKMHIIDTSRNGAPIPGGNRQADTGWPDWCDPTAARVGAPPMVSTGVPLMSTMWIKPPGETDGCYGGSSTVGTPGRDGRGSPFDGLAAGTFRYDLACRLVTGSTTCPEKDYYSTAPPIPSGLKITSAATDQIALQWNPSLGACAYQIGYRINGGSIRAIVTFGDGTQTPWPQTQYYLTGAQIKHGAKVEYSVRARSCGVTPYYSRYSGTAVTYDYP